MNGQTDCDRRAIVRQYIENNRDNTARLTCLLYMRGCDDGIIRKTLRLTRLQLAEVKARISHDLIIAGIQPRT